MKELLFKNYKDIIALFLIVICFLALVIMDSKISDSLRQTLSWIITGCIGFIFRGNI
jgi:hypothetical protein